MRKCTLCQTDQTTKWYKLEDGYLCQKDYRKLVYTKNKEKEQNYSKAYYEKNKDNKKRDYDLKKNGKYRNFKDKECWQYHIRKLNLKEDIQAGGLSEVEISKLKVDDFDFNEGGNFKEAREFIIRHEWLGTVPQFIYRIFTCHYKDILAGVIIVTLPYSNSNLIGKTNANLELLIARGACISWAPKCLNSSLVMYAIKWLATNTKYRLFTAYSDPKANEIGTIYQACNFDYLGQAYGVNKLYYDPDHPEWGWFSARKFGSKTFYKYMANQLGFEWDSGWSPNTNFNTNFLPNEVKEKISIATNMFKSKCQSKIIPSKHKYAYILGKDKRETRYYRKVYASLNQIKLSYPKR